MVNYSPQNINRYTSKRPYTEKSVTFNLDFKSYLHKNQTKVRYKRKREKKLYTLLNLMNG